MIVATLIGIRNMDGRFATMLKAKLFCEENQLSYPKEIEEYFGNDVGEDEGYIRAQMQQVCLARIDGERWRDIEIPDKIGGVTIGTDEYDQWIEFDTRSIPGEFSRIRLNLHYS
jgi:hypothetical protein